MSKHLFALYLEDLHTQITQVNPGDTFSLKDNILFNRLTKILRLTQGHGLILFDKKIHAQVKLETADKKIVTLKIVAKEENHSLKPSLTLLLPILKKEAFDSTIYVAAQMGVTTIVPIFTEKSSRIIPKHDRLQKIMIAACEQSKNFVLPKIKNPQEFIEAIENTKENASKICFDEHGAPARELTQKFTQNLYEPLVVTLGPEGGFGDEEKEVLKKAGFDFYRLTPTILRSREAVTVGVGLVRSLTEPQRSAT